MRRSLLVAVSVVPLLLATGFAATAQYRFGGGAFRAGGFHGYGVGVGMRPAFPAYRPGWQGGWGWRGAGFYPRSPYYGGGYYPYRRYGGWGGYPYWGAGLATAATLGAVAAYPAYAYPDYPAYPAYEVVPTADGGQCSTPIRICTLYAPAPLGTGCSCRVPGGHARGTVVGF